GKNIFDPKYNNASGSKANRLRAFWKLEPNHIVGKLLADLIAYATRDVPLGEIVPREEGNLYVACHNAAQRLIKSAAVAEADALCLQRRWRSEGKFDGAENRREDELHNVVEALPHRGVARDLVSAEISQRWGDSEPALKRREPWHEVAIRGGLRS